MTSSTLRALVVDDEALVCRLTTRALTQQGFACDIAVDGKEAEQLTGRHDYDVIITDLRMPNKNGHALALSLLELERRPLIIVHTGVLEPRLAKDLLLRGVDDVVFKPVDFGFLAAKVKTMIERREPQADADRKPDASDGSEGVRPQLGPADEPVTLFHLEQRLAGVSRLLPISQAAIDVYSMTADQSWEIAKIAGAMRRDVSLVADVLRLANSSFYNASGESISSLEQAIIRIGQKRIGELSLATSALSALTPGLLPWVDVELIWKRSIAAGLALDMLIELGEHHLQQGLLLSAIMHPLGRVVLGTLFPKHYEAMIGRCRQQGETLEEQERQVFPLQHTEIMAHLLSSWNIPADIHLPLKFSLDDYTMLARLAEPMRSRAELVKLAIFAGRLAVGRWESWDLVQLPPASLLKRLRIKNLALVIEQTRVELEKLAELRPDRLSSRRVIPRKQAPRSIIYCDLAGEPNFLLDLLVSMGLEASVCDPEALAKLGEPAVVNCMGMEPARFEARCPNKSGLLVISDPDRCDTFSRFAKAISVPNSYGRLYTTLMAASQREQLEATQ